MLPAVAAPARPGLRASKVLSAFAAPARLWLIATIAVLPLGCSVGPDFKHPDPHAPAQWSSMPASAAPNTGPQAPPASAALNTQPQATADWWNTFHEPMLTSLIERGATSNLDLRAAVLRITEARAQREVAAAAFWPTVDANASFTRQRLSEKTATGAAFTGLGNVKIPGVSVAGFPNPYNQFQLGATASWEVDLFGRVRRSVEAANADLQASIEDQHAVYVSLCADVARAYMELRGAQLRKQVTDRSLATQKEIYDLTVQRRAVGLTTEFDVANAGAQLDSTQAQVPQLDSEVTQDINQLSLLLGREPGALRTELTAVQAVPQVPPVIPIGLPADLARRRPDIRQSEARLHAATARIGVAVGNLFPRLTLSASAGTQSETGSDLLKWASRFGSIGPTFDLPIFDGSRWATVRLQNVKAQEAALDYQRTVLSALHEVENALAVYTADRDRGVSLAKAVEEGRDALTLARQRYSSGVANFMDVLDAERTLQQNELSLATNTTATATDAVAIYRALGGGWETNSVPNH
jgi:NodT family efflux transporter outer membrane factor (OMF) lipoprotein